VLVILLGKATKLSGILSLKDKTYVAKMNLHKIVSKTELLKALKHFTGEIEQLVPKLSAVKRQVRTRKIHYIKLLSLKDRIARIEVKCQHGTYIRKLIHDIGEHLGIGAHMFELERIKSGRFTIRDALTLSKIEKYVRKEKFSFILPPAAGIKNELKVYVDKYAAETVAKGTPVFVPGVLKSDKFTKGDIIAIMHKKQLIALGVAKLSIAELKKQRHGVAVKTDLVLV